MRNILIGIAIGLILGWIFPVEGPIDYIYDEQVKKTPSKSVAAPNIVEYIEEELPYMFEEEQNELRKVQSLDE